jgi:predicted choloylglycine hydrolase
MSTYTRREFLSYSLAAAAGVALLPQTGCSSPSGTREGVLDVPVEGYPIVEVEGSHREIGRQIASVMRERIASHLEFSPQYRDSVEYLDGEGRETVEKMQEHAQASFPHLIEEVEGMAEALDIPFERLFAFQCRAEIRMLKDPPGCSTIALRDGDDMILVHNEDGNDLNVGRMFLVKVTPPSGVTFLSFVYPGLLPGNGPSVNDAGLVQTTNYIQPRRVADGIPRYFIGRAILEAKSLDEAVSLATMTPRAFSYHHNLVHLPERRILSVEVAAYPEHKHSVEEVDGLYVHTNHFLHPGMTGKEKTGPQPYDVPYESSTTRMAVLSRAIEKKGPPANVEEIMKLLTLHKGQPYSPCRHPEGDVHGATLGTAVFRAPAKTMTLFHGNPCRGLRREHTV